MNIPGNAEPTAYAYDQRNGHPYHRLGTAVHGSMTVEEGLKLIGCREEVIEHRNLFVVTEDYTNFGQGWFEGELRPAEDFTAIYSSKYGVMGVLKPTYEIIDRRDALTIAMDLIGLYPADAALDTIGNIGNRGEVFFAYIKLPEWTIDPGGVAEVIERGFVVMTSFNGQFQTTINETLIRPECMNSLVLGTKKMANGVSTRHLGGAEDRLRRAAAAKDFAGAKEKEVERRVKAMLSMDGDRTMNRLFKHFLPVRGEMPQRTRTRRLQDQSTIMELYSGADNVSASKLGENGYAAYQAFVEFQDHRRLVRTRGGDEGMVRAQAAVMPGAVVNKKFAAQEIVLGMV